MIRFLHLHGTALSALALVWILVCVVTVVAPPAGAALLILAVTVTARNVRRDRQALTDWHAEHTKTWGW